MALSIADIDNLEHEPLPGARKTIMYGKTAGGAFVPVLVNADGSLPISGDVENFLDLTDTPSAYAGNTLDIVRVNAGETALEFVDPSVIGATINFNDLGDVDTTGVAIGDFVQFDGANWLDFNLFGTANVWSENQTLGSADLVFIEGGVTTRILTETLNGSNIVIQRDTIGTGTFIVRHFDAAITNMNSIFEGNVTIGGGRAGIDYRLTFDGETNDGIIDWMEDEDRFDFADDILLTASEKLFFRDTAISIHSSVDGQLDIDADVEVQINADLDLPSQVGSGSFLWTEATGRLLYTLSDDSSSAGFKIVKTETIKPSGAPEYFDVDITRSWTGGGAPLNLLNFKLTDSGTIQSPVVHLSRIFNLEWTRTGESAVAVQPRGLRISLTESGTFTGTVQSDVVFFESSGGSTPASNTASNITATLTGWDFNAQISPTNAGSGTATGENRLIFWDPQFSQISTDTINATGFILKPNIFQVGAGPTYNFVGIDAIPTFQFDQGGTLTSIGFRYNPSGASVGNATHTAFISTRGTWHNQADNVKSFWGGGDDVSFQFTGTIFEITFEQTTTEMVINQGGANTDFRIESDTNINMFFLDAGNNRIGIGVNNPAVTLDVDGDIWVRSQGDVRWGDADNSNFVAFQGASTISANVTWTLPSADGTANQVLTTSGATILSWTTVSAGHGTGFISVTTNENSATQNGEADVFDQNNYGGALTLDADTVTASNINFTATNGRFTVTEPGKFCITVTVNIRNTLSTVEGHKLILLKNDVEIYNHQFEVDFSKSGLENSMVLSKIVTMADNQYFNIRTVFGGTLGMPEYIMLNGCTCTIHKIDD